MKLKQLLLILVLLSAYTVLISKPIRLTIGDLGRHLKNGEIIVKSLSIPKTNLFTFTNGEFPFINHHWGSGVIFYIIDKVLGLSGLHIFLIFLSLITFLFFFDIASRYANFYLALWLSILVLPLLASRPELRPEIFSNFFSGIFFWILINYKHRKISAKYLIFLPLIQLVWVNLHIYFFLGLVIIAAFALEEFIQILLKRGAVSENFKNLSLVLISALVTSSINPSGISGAIYPLRIFNNYGYTVEENIAAFAMDDITAFIPNAYFYPTVLLFLISSIFVWMQFRKIKKSVPIALFIIGFVIMTLGLAAIRNFALFGYFALAIIPINIWGIMSSQPRKMQIRRWLLLALGFTAAVMVVFYVSSVPKILSNFQFNIVLEKSEEKPGEFFVKNKIQGPIFNDFNIGGYLVYYLYPKYQLFIDNRPEAAPASFFKNVYIPILEDDQKWQTALDKYQFNAIFFYRLSRSKPTLQFLLRRMEDPKWAVVFVDNHTIIFLRNNDINKGIIEKNRIQKDITLIYASSIKEGSHETIF